MAHGTIEATYRVTTPLFCGGADPESAELRLPSFKGVLRFWWRTLAWSRFQGDLGGIKREEDEIFGSAAGGQSRVVMRLASAGEPKVLAGGTELRANGKVVGEGARYLGYGVMEAFASRAKGTQPGQLQRACLKAPFDSTVHLRCRDLRQGQVDVLTDALLCLGCFGGMGAKSRKGYGSLALRALRVAGEDRWRAPRSESDLAQAIGKLCPQRRQGGLPEYTAFSAESRHVLVWPAGGGGSPLEVLNLIGREMMRYRSWGHDGMVLGEPSEKNFRPDHDLMKGREQRRAHPRRIAFGLPHNYGRGQHLQVGPGDKSLDRRASPLFIHLHDCGNSSVAVLSFLPARFLPKGRSHIGVGRDPVLQKHEHELYAPVRDFLDRFLDPSQRKEPLEAREVPK